MREEEAKRFYARNLVSDKEIATVSRIFKSLDLPIKTIEPGLVHTTQLADKATRKELQSTLKKKGFSLVMDWSLQRISHAKCLIKDIIYYRKKKEIDVSFIKYLPKKVGISYAELTLLFACRVGLSVSDYIAQKRVKQAQELLLTKYNKEEYNVEAIAKDLGYNHSEYLYMQFKKMTGQTIGRYLSENIKERRTFSLH